MGLPRLIEFIESIQRPTGGLVAEHGWSQQRSTSFTAGATTTTTITPAAGKFAHIIYRIEFAPVMVPDVFSVNLQQEGHGVMNVTLTQAFIVAGVDLYMPVTHASPLRVIQVNNSNMDQYSEVIYSYAIIASNTDYDVLITALEDESMRGDGAARGLARGLADVRERRTR